MWTGKPNQSAALTCDQSTRQCSTALPPELGVTDVIWPNTLSASQEMTYPKIRPRKIAIRPAKPRRPTAIRITAVMVIRAIQ